jgi:hypothetical protein
VPTAAWVLLGSGESNKRLGVGSLYTQLVCGGTLPLGRKSVHILIMIVVTVEAHSIDYRMERGPRNFLIWRADLSERPPKSGCARGTQKRVIKPTIAPTTPRAAAYDGSAFVLQPSGAWFGLPWSDCRSAMYGMKKTFVKNCNAHAQSQACLTPPHGSLRIQECASPNKKDSLTASLGRNSV